MPLIPQEHTPALESRQTHAQKRVESATAVTPSDDDSDAHSDGDFPKLSQEIGFPSQVLEEVHVAPIEGDTTEVPAAVDMLIEGESFTMALVPYSNLPLASDDSCLLQSKKGENRKFLSDSKSPRLMVFSKEEVFSDLRAFNTKLQLLFATEQQQSARPRGRPRKTYFTQLLQRPSKTLVTRSSKFSTQSSQ